LLEESLAKIGTKTLSLGVIDGRNIWKNDLSASLTRIERAIEHLGKERVFIAPSCSLLHSPVDLGQETKLDATVRNWLAFATQKLTEIATLARGATQGREAIRAALGVSDSVQQERRTSVRIHDRAVQQRLAAITPEMKRRGAPYATRSKLQRAAFELPLFPTTTIGSFPQTERIRQTRAAFKKGEIDADTYRAAMRGEIAVAVEHQHRIGLDVLVHGEPE